MSDERIFGLVKTMRQMMQEEGVTYLEAEEACWRVLIGLLFECFPDAPIQVASALERVAKSAADRIRLGAIAAVSGSLQ